MSKDILDDILDPVGGNESVTYVAFVRDHSGSMAERLPDNMKTTKADLAMINFNNQIETLKKESETDMETLVTVVEFDDTVKNVDRNKLIKNVEPLTNYWTGGMTALYDAIAKAIGEVSRAMAKDTRTDKAALVIIQTDGNENYSTEFSGRDGQKRLQTYISDLEKSGIWTFVFLGENIDEKLATEIGMTPKNFMRTASTQASYKMSSEIVMDGLSDYYDMRKMGATQTKSFFGDEEEDEGREVRNVNRT
jgi:uncharacterized protein YegL